VANKPIKVKLSDAIISYAKSGKSDNSKLKDVESALINKGDILYDTELKGFHVKRAGIDTVSFRHYYRINGQRKNITLGTFPNITVAAARILAREKSLDVANGNSPVDEKRNTLVIHQLTLKNYLEHDYALHMERAITGKQYIAKIKNHFPELLKKPLADINKTDLVKWLQQNTIKYKNFESGYSAESIRGYYSALKTLMAHAVRNAAIDSSPFDRMEKLDFHREEKAAQQVKRNYLTIEQQRAFLASIDNYQEKLRSERRSSRAHGKSYLPDLDNIDMASHHKPMLLILYYMGMRSGDVIGLEWEHIIDTPFTCSISKVLEKNRRKIKTPSTIPMPVQVRDILRVWRKQLNNPDSGLVFMSPVTGRRLSKGCLNNCWDWIKNDAGIPEQYVLYTLRHNFISWLIMNGIHLKVIANLAGHTTTSMIEHHYGHLSDGHTNKAAMSFSNLLSDDSENQENIALVK